MYLVIGANGFLGSYIIKAILENTNDSVLAVARNIGAVPDFDAARVSWKSCDISDFSAVDALSDDLNSSTGRVKVIYLAAIHNPDLVEKDPRAAWHTNITSLSYFMNKIQNVERFFYPSTDSVYGNSVNHYHFKEEDPLEPVNRYGRHKVLAERLVVGYGYCVVRYPFLIAPSLLKHKKHFYDQIASDLLAGNAVKMFSDSIRSSLDFGQAARLLVKLAEKPVDSVPKILNICGDNDYSKYDIGLMIADKLKASRSLIQPISIINNHDVFIAERAVSTLMDNTKAKKALGLKKIEIQL